jgi:hypothetical protein
VPGCPFWETKTSLRLYVCHQPTSRIVNLASTVGSRRVSTRISREGFPGRDNEHSIAHHLEFHHELRYEVANAVLVSGTSPRHSYWGNQLLQASVSFRKVRLVHFMSRPDCCTRRTLMSGRNIRVSLRCGFAIQPH